MSSYFDLDRSDFLPSFCRFICTVRSHIKWLWNRIYINPATVTHVECSKWKLTYSRNLRRYWISAKSVDQYRTNRIAFVLFDCWFSLVFTSIVMCVNGIRISFVQLFPFLWQILVSRHFLKSQPILPLIMFKSSIHNWIIIWKKNGQHFWLCAAIANMCTGIWSRHACLLCAK